jgi:anti-anti-sigma regulatory factor
MVKAGKMIIRNVNDVVQEVFDMTGFADILNIE